MPSTRSSQFATNRFEPSNSSARGRAIGLSSTDPKQPVLDEMRTTSQPLSVSRKNFCGVDDMKQVSEINGWTIDVNQINAGKLFASTNFIERPDISLIEDFSDRRLEIVGSSPRDVVTVLLPCDDTELWFNGRINRSDQACLLPADTEIHLMTCDKNRTLTAHISTDLLDSSSSALLGRRFPGLPENGFIPQLNGPAIEYLRQLMLTALYVPRTGIWNSENSAQIAEFLIRVTGINAEYVDNTSGDLTSNMASKTIKRLRRCVESHLKKPVSMQHLCQCAAVSLSKMERLFKREFNLTPSQYVVARRLQASRRDLQKLSCVNVSVARIANDYGFHHLGRFSSVYKRQFGELPSKTLRSRN